MSRHAGAGAAKAGLASPVKVDRLGRRREREGDSKVGRKCQVLDYADATCWIESFSLEPLGGADVGRGARVWESGS